MVNFVAHPRVFQSTAPARARSSPRRSMAAVARGAMSNESLLQSRQEAPASSVADRLHAAQSVNAGKLRLTVSEANSHTSNESERRAIAGLYAPRSLLAPLSVNPRTPRRP